MSRTKIRRAAGVAVAGLLLLGACSSGGDEEAVDADAAADTSAERSDDQVGDDDGAAAPDDQDDDPTSTPETVPEDTGASTPGGEGGDDGGSDGSAPAATDPAPTSTEPAGEQPPPEESAGASAATPVTPRAGTYTYERTTTTDEGTETEESDAVVERLSGDDVNARLRIQQESPQGQVTSTASAGPDGTLIESSVIDSPLGEVDCDWQPDWLFVGRYETGSTWTVDTSCSDDSGTLQVEVAIQGSGTVVGVETITVRGRTLDVWVVETTLATDVEVSTATATQTSTSETTDRTWVDPANGMPVRSESSSTTSGDFGSGKSSQTSELIAYSA